MRIPRSLGSIPLVFALSLLNVVAHLPTFSSPISSYHYLLHPPSKMKKEKKRERKGEDKKMEEMGKKNDKEEKEERK